MVEFILNLVSSWGYVGIFLMMTLESSFFPFPSEVVMIPAGYLARNGQMNIFFAFLSGVGGSIFGALFNYYFCKFFGLKFINRYGVFVGITEPKMQKFRAFFDKHGEISTFTCRLIPGIRQYISLPAGLAGMNIFKFIFFTALGASIWVGILLGCGYFIGENEQLLRQNLHIITVLLLLFVLIVIAIYKKVRI